MNLDTYFMNNKELFEFLTNLSSDKAMIEFIAHIDEKRVVTIEEDPWILFGKTLTREDVEDALCDFTVTDEMYEGAGLYSFKCLANTEIDADNYRSWVVLDFLYFEMEFMITDEDREKQAKEASMLDDKLQWNL